MGNKHSTQVISEAILDLSVDFYENVIQLAPEKVNETVIYSPFQLFTTFFIYYLCTDGESKQQLSRFLRLENKSDASIQNALTKLIMDLHQNQWNEDGFGIQLMSGIFLCDAFQNQLQLKFRKTMTIFAHKVELHFVRFKRRVLEEVVDRWSTECTNGNIHFPNQNHSLAPPLFHVDLFSIVDHFDFPCTAQNSHDSEMIFYAASGRPFTVSSAYAVGKFRYIYDVTYKIRIIELGMKSSPDLGVLIILPDHRDGFKNIKSTKFLKDEVKMWLDSMTVESDLEVFLPCIKISSLVKVDEIISPHSPLAIFNEHDADLSGMAPLTTSPLFLTSLHANYYVDLSFNLLKGADQSTSHLEESLVYQESSAMPYRVEHPFKLIIYHRISKTIFLVANVETLNEVKR